MPIPRLLALVALPLAVVGTAAALTLGSAAALGDVRAPGPATLDALLAVTAAAAAWAVFGWLVGGLLLAVAAGVGRWSGPLDRIARATTPVAIRRLAALLLGLGLVGAPLALALPAQAARVQVTATDQPGTASPSPGLPASPALDGWTPDRPAPPPARSPSARPPSASASASATQPSALLVPRPHRERAVSDHVVVRRGDTLWDIAARALGPDASDADIAASWPRWHAANRSTIGPDPDLILPGQLLGPPGP
jgi:hypothetical protein